MALRDSEIRALRALRAGPLTRYQAEERWPGCGSAPLYSLSRAGLAVYDGAQFTITDAGRAACPFNNPILAARAGGKPKEETPMTKKLNDRSDVFAAICAAGPDGTTVRALAERLGMADYTIRRHLVSLMEKPLPAVRRPRYGLLVASRFLDGADDPAVAEVPESEVAKVAREYDEMIDFDLEAAQSVDLTAQPPTLGEAASLAAVNRMLDALPKLGSEDPANRHGVTPTAPAPFSEDIELDDPEQVEFAIFSSGGLDMYTDQGNVTLSRDVLRKLRAFLGLFAEGA